MRKFFEHAKNDPSLWFYTITFTDDAQMSNVLTSGYPDEVREEMEPTLQSYTSAVLAGDTEAMKKYSNELRHFFDDDQKFLDFMSNVNATTGISKWITDFSDYYNKAEQAYKEGKITDEEWQKVQEDTEQFRNTFLDLLDTEARNVAYSESGYELKDYINEIQDLSQDDFGKNDKIYY
jgi:hypothetical protein